MKSILLTLAIVAFVGLSGSSVFAFTVGKGDPVDCARIYRNCLENCNRQEAIAKAAKALCERTARITYPNGGAAYNAAIRDCRDAYNSAMLAVSQCRYDCKQQYLSCTSGGEQQPD